MAQNKRERWKREEREGNKEKFTSNLLFVTQHFHHLEEHHFRFIFGIGTRIIVHERDITFIVRQIRVCVTVRITAIMIIAADHRFCRDR